MLPVSLRLVYALNSATFQVSSLALLSIVNTRASIPAEYLPAYGAISFLPYSLRPIFAWFSSSLLKNTKTAEENRHDKLLFPAFLIASLSFVGTVFIPSGGIILCFVWGFIRGIAGAWSDFLIGMSVIEFSKLQARFSFCPRPPDEVGSCFTYERIVSVNTAQSSTAKNLGSFVSSIATFLFFTKQRDLKETTANKLLLGTAAIFLLASLVSLKFQYHNTNLLSSLNIHYDVVNNADDEDIDESTSISSTNDTQYTTSFQQHSLPGRSDSETVQSDDSDGISSHTTLSRIEDVTESNHAQYNRQFVEVSTLVAFQILLATSSLQKPIIALSNQTAWVSLVAASAIAVIFTISLGYRYECRKTTDSFLSVSGASSRSSGEEERKHHTQSHRLPHRRLNLYFLLRYSMPIAGFLMYSYLYSVFESDPMFLQLLSLLKTAIGSVSTFCYEKFISPYCHSGWRLIFLIATLDIIVGLVALLDVWVIRSVRENEVEGEYSVDIQLRWMVIAVGLTKYFFAELDYMPALVLSTTNVYSVDEVRSKDGHDGEQAWSSGDDNDVRGQSAERASLSDNFTRSNNSSFCMDLNNEEECDTVRPPAESSAPKWPAMSTGMQYASFLSCIDFGAQIGDWITIPIVSSLGITRENHWDHLDKLVIICSIFRMTRVVFLVIICPPIHPEKKANNSDRIDFGSASDTRD